jgi:aminoglycoside phosphotransferase (APT) family kinase protein
MSNEDACNDTTSALAVKIAASLYGITPLAHSFPSARSHVFRLDFGDRLEDRIIKIAEMDKAQDVLREQQILPALHARGFEVPIIEYTQDNCDYTVPFTVMPFVQGVGIGDVGGMPSNVAKAVYEHLGHFVGRLSVLDAQTIPGGRTRAEVCAQVEHNWIEGAKQLRIHPRFTPRLALILDRGRELGQDADGFAHWDGPQIITDGVSTFTVIDWGGAGAGHRLVDLGIFLMGHGYWVFRQQRKGLPVFPDWRAAVLRGFLGGRNLSEETRTHLHFLGMSQCILDAMSMAKHKSPNIMKASDDLLTFIESNDVAFETNPL